MPRTFTGWQFLTRRLPEDEGGSTFSGGFPISCKIPSFRRCTPRAGKKPAIPDAVRRFFSAGSFLIRRAINQPRFRDTYVSTYVRKHVRTCEPREKLEQNNSVPLLSIDVFAWSCSLSARSRFPVSKIPSLRAFQAFWTCPTQEWRRNQRINANRKLIGGTSSSIMVP